MISNDVIEQDRAMKTPFVSDNVLINQVISNLIPLQINRFKSSNLFVGILCIAALLLIFFL